LAPLAVAAQVPAPPKEGKDTLRSLWAWETAAGGGGFGVGRGGGGAGATTPPPDPAVGPRRIKQLGVDHVLSGGGPAPWTEQSLNTTMERWKAAASVSGT